MTDNPTPALELPADGRQSPAALDIQRGVVRVLAAYRFATVTELPLANGLRADAVGLSPKGDFWIVEIKSGIADFRADAKWPGYLDYCDELYFAVAPGFPADVLPDEAYPVDSGAATYSVLNGRIRSVVRTNIDGPRALAFPISECIF